MEVTQAFISNPGYQRKSRRTTAYSLVIVLSSKNANKSTKMEDMPNKERMFFDAATGTISPTRPNDKAIAVDMNKQGSGGFFSFTVKEARECFMSLTMLGDIVEEFPRNQMQN